MDSTISSDTLTRTQTMVAAVGCSEASDYSPKTQNRPKRWQKWQKGGRFNFKLATRIPKLA